MIPVYRPYIHDSLKYAHDALDSGWLSSHGYYLEKATETLRNLLGCNVLLTNNGTTATHLVAKAIKYRHPEISTLIVPNNVYVAAINSFLFDRDLSLVTVDADLNTWNYDLQKLKSAIQQYTRDGSGIAVLIVHNIGNIIDVVGLKTEYPAVTFVEDNCEGFIGEYQNQYSGTAGLASSISFFGNKNITSGEGGAVLVPDDDLYDYLKCIHGQGQSSTRFVHSELGYNYRMTNVQAAILLGQLELLSTIQLKKFELFKRFREFVQDRQDVFCQTIDPKTRHSNWMFGVRVPAMPNYQSAEDFFRHHGIEIRPMFYPLSSHRHLMMENRILLGEETVANKLNKTCFILPSYPDLSTPEVDHILTTLESYLGSL